MITIRIYMYIYLPVIMVEHTPSKRNSQKT